MQYVLHCVTRKAAHRGHRAALPAAQRKRQYIGPDQLRILPARPMLISEEMLRANIEELRSKVAQRAVEVRTVDGRLVDLSTMKVGSAAPTPVPPHPRLDSVANDMPVGMYIPPSVGDGSAMPYVLPPGEKPQLLKQAAQTAALDAQAESQLTEENLEAAIATAQQQAAAFVVPAPAPVQQEQVSFGGGFKHNKHQKHGR